MVPAALNFLPHTLRNEIPCLLVCVLYHHSWILPANAFSSARMPMPPRYHNLSLNPFPPPPPKPRPSHFHPTSQKASPSKQNPKITRTQRTLTHTLPLLLTQNLPFQLLLLQFQLLLLLLKKKQHQQQPKRKITTFLLNPCTLSFLAACYYYYHHYYYYCQLKEELKKEKQQQQQQQGSLTESKEDTETRKKEG
jgi:hypothetical protein